MSMYYAEEMDQAADVGESTAILRGKHGNLDAVRSHSHLILSFKAALQGPCKLPLGNTSIADELLSYLLGRVSPPHS